MTALVLASASAVRAQVLRAVGVEFEVAPADIDEDTVKQSMSEIEASPREIALELATRKARRISERRPQALVIGADQVLELDGKALSKSRTSGGAREQLKRLRGRHHDLISAVVLSMRGEIMWQDVAISRLWVRAFSDVFLDDYIAREGADVLRSVGGYRLEGLGAQLFERVDGDYFSILGLQIMPLLAVLRQQGVLAT